jgi:hypothetical protein
MNRKLLFYERYGVEEYYIYDPNKNDLSGFQRQDSRLTLIETMDSWVSPRLGIRFELIDPELILYHPDNQPFSTYTDERQRADKERQRAAKLAAKLQELGINPADL